MRPAPGDRDRVVGNLRSALVGGAIGLDTFEMRVGAALNARTRWRLRALVTDLPTPAWRRAIDALRDTLLGSGEPEVVAIHPPPDIAVGDTLMIGRRSDANLVLDDPGVSRRHVMLSREADGWSVRDLRSTNGTFVNGWRIDRARLSAGDVLQVGDTCLRMEAPR